jgi:galactokinase
VEAWQRGDLDRFGELMRASGESSIHNYECGAPHLIEIFEILSDCPGVYGARFSGGGFRGACIGLSDPAARETIREAVQARYPARFPEMRDRFRVYFCQPGGGAELWRGLEPGS